MEKLKKILPMLISALRSIIKHAFIVCEYLAVKYIFFFFSSTYTYNQNERTFWECSILVIVWLSTAYAFNVYNKNQCVLFIEKEKVNFLKEYLSFDFLFDTAVMILTYYLFSGRYLYPVTIPIVFAINVLTYYFVRRIWLRDKVKNTLVHFQVLRLIAHLLLSVFGITVLFILVGWLIPATPTLIIILKLLLIPLGLYFLMVPFFYLKSLSKRRKFLAQFKKTCQEKGAPFPEIKNKYLSVFSNSASVPFVFELNEKKYECKLLSFTDIFKPLIINSNGRYHRISPRRLKTKTTPTFVFERAYEFESDLPKMLILTSYPYNVFVETDNKKRTIDASDSCEDYMIFTPSGFFGAIGRNLLQKKHHGYTGYE